MLPDRITRTRPARRAALLVGASLAALLAGIVPAAAAGQPSSPPAADPAVLDSHGRMVVRTALNQVAPQASTREADRLPLLKRLLAERQTQRRDLVGRQITPLSRREALHQGLIRNLNLAIAQKNPDRARELLREVEAVFDPVFDFQIGYTYSASFLRTKVGLVAPRAVVVTFVQGSDTLDLPPNPFTSEPQIIALKSIGSGALATDKTPQNLAITANPANQFGHPKQQISYTLGLTQQLPWGGQLTLTDQTVQQDVFYRREASWDDRQFTTNFTGALVTPVPMTRGFGDTNANNSAIRSQRVAIESADWQVKAVANQIARDIDVAWLETVRTVESLKFANENRALIGQLRGRMNRLFDQGLGTRFQKAQLDNEYAKANIRVEDALQAYINASVTLARLIGDPDAVRASAVYLPYAEGADLGKELPFQFDSVMAAAKQNRPELFLAGLNKQQAEIALGLAQNNARANVQLSASATSGQNGSVFGYENPAQSHARIFRPDRINQNYGVTYTWPWLNRGPDATVERNEFQVADSDVAIQDAANAVRQDVTNGLSQLQSARSRMRHNADQVKGLKSAVASLERRLDVGIVSEDELITTSRQLLDAELSRISAAIAAKQAETNLLFAQGTIGGSLLTQTAQSTVDKNRLQMLADAGHLAYFSQPKAEGGQGRK